MAKKKVAMDIINPHCAGIDIGSRSHFVAVGQELEDVKEFGVYADDLTDICLHLKEHEVTSVAIPTDYVFLDEKRKLGLVKRIRKQIDKFALTNEDLGFVTN